MGRGKETVGMIFCTSGSNPPERDQLNTTYKKKPNILEGKEESDTSDRACTGTALQENGSLGFQRYRLLDLVEITQASLRGRAQGVWVHLQDLLWAPPQAGLWVSASQKHNSQHEAFIWWFTGILWSSCMSKKLHSTVCIPRLLMMHFRTLFLTGVHFNIWKIMCQTHASAVGLLSVYLGEKFTHSLMSQSLRALRRSFMWELLLCFAFWSHGIITNDDYTALLPKHGQRGSRNSVYERKVYKYSTGKVYVQDVPSQNPMPFCSQWQPQWF